MMNLIVILLSFGGGGSGQKSIPCLRSHVVFEECYFSILDD